MNWYEGFYEEKTLADDKLYYRRTPGGGWSIKPPPIDVLMSEIHNRINSFGRRSLQDVLQAIGMDSATLTRIRKGQTILSPTAILKIHDATGISVRDIRRLSETAPTEYWNKNHHGKEIEPQSNTGKLQKPSEEWR